MGKTESNREKYMTAIIIIIMTFIILLQYGEYISLSNDKRCVEKQLLHANDRWMEAVHKIDEISQERVNVVPFRKRN